LRSVSEGQLSTPALATPDLTARDALHAAVMERESIDRILSLDAGFDRFAFVTRIYD
jgi:predicted nucleic acid-binding protein